LVSIISLNHWILYTKFFSFNRIVVCLTTWLAAFDASAVVFVSGRVQQSQPIEVARKSQVFFMIYDEPSSQK